MPNKLLETLTIDSTSLDIWRLPNEAQSLAAIPTQSIPNNSMVSIPIWTAPKDCLLIASATGRFDANATGLRHFEVFRGAQGISACQQVDPSSTAYTVLSVPVITHVPQGDQIIVKVMQRSGSALNLYDGGRYGFVIDMPE